ncbi:FAD-binding oxidoreductase [Sphingopyxis sp. MC1]|uniref:FAD-binding oxidoreductase n=1 Tax=Sphingopyxis sp. MC1 TaxID=1174684 RepID=UPI0002D15719|nr:FAD-binding oxidoreductase [Sphingopyxis sp. MC1]ENY80192.1 FAD linked oxidase domain-containing protein [Sphingopyxis sp. MC1]
MSVDTDEIVAALGVIVGARHVLVGEDVSSRWDGYPPVSPVDAACIVRPADTSQVSAVLSWCNDNGVSVVPHGGRTGLSGGARARASDVVISLERMRAIGAPDKAAGTIVVEGGAIIQAAQDAALAQGMIFPVDFGARGTATVGGAIATNAGGNSVLRYGMTRDNVLGLEAVLADGTVIDAMNTLIKNNTGYDVKQLFIGSEGTLGIVTRAVLRLQPQVSATATAFLGLDSFDQALSLLSHARSMAAGALSSFEVMWPSFVGAVESVGRNSSPLEGRHRFYVLIEVGCADAEQVLQDLIEDAWQQGILADAAIAQSLAQAESFWALRDDIEALMHALSPAFAYDVSLPQGRMDQYVVELEAALSERWPEARAAVFGHMGDGNLHIVVSTGSADDHALVDALVYAPLAQWGGSISAEHGIGQDKRAWLAISRSPAEIALMRQTKHMLDPRGTLNPGKVLPCP